MVPDSMTLAEIDAELKQLAEQRARLKRLRREEVCRLKYDPSKAHLDRPIQFLKLAVAIRVGWELALLSS